MNDVVLKHPGGRLQWQRHELWQPLRWRPAADVYRLEAGWLIKLELAGVDPGQIDVRLQERRLSVQGRRRDITLYDGYACQAMEIAYTEFHREFDLPAELDGGELDIRYRDGMLLIAITPQVSNHE